MKFSFLFFSSFLLFLPRDIYGLSSDWPFDC
jgi:hypothetical protein